MPALLLPAIWDKKVDHTWRCLPENKNLSCYLYVQSTNLVQCPILIFRKRNRLVNGATLLNRSFWYLRRGKAYKIEKLPQHFCKACKMIVRHSKHLKVSQSRKKILVHLQFSQKMNTLMLIFALAYWGKKFSFLFLGVLKKPKSPIEINWHLKRTAFLSASWQIFRTFNLSLL